MPHPILPRLALLSALAVPVTGLSLAAYLYNQPLAAAKTRAIISTETLSPTCASSASVRAVVNPRHHVQWTDSYTIRLSRAESSGATDAELLARLVKGYFGGWIFTPEKSLLALLAWFGAQLVPVGFSSK